MALNATIRSETIYRAPQVTEETETKPSLTENIQAHIDSIIEYPGSVKGDFGHWVLTEWVDAKIEQIVSHGRNEIK